MEIRLLDYMSNEVIVDVGKIENIAVMSMEVISGDEILTVINKDYTVEVFDSSDWRMMDFHDDEYDIYNITTRNEYA